MPKLIVLVIACLNPAGFILFFLPLRHFACPNRNPSRMRLLVLFCLVLGSVGSPIPDVTGFSLFTQPPHEYRYLLKSEKSFQSQSSQPRINVLSSQMVT